MISNSFTHLASSSSDRCITQSEVILKLELEINTINCEIFTASLELEAAQVLAEKAIAFSSDFKNDAQRKAALGSKLQGEIFLNRRRAITNLRFKKAHTEAQLGAAIRLFEIDLAQLKAKT